MIPWSENLQLDPRQVSGTQPCKSWPWSFETERSPWQGMTTGMENATWKLGAPIAGWVIVENPIKMDDEIFVPLFSGNLLGHTSITILCHTWGCLRMAMTRKRWKGWGNKAFKFFWSQFGQVWWDHQVKTGCLKINTGGWIAHEIHHTTCCHTIYI